MEKRQVKVTVTRGSSYTMDGKTEVNEPVEAIGVFHEWEQYQEGNFSKKYALVELEDGTIKRIDAEDITFTNKPIGANLFEEGLDFEEKK